MKDRITKFLIKENISSAEFADKIGVQRSSVSHVLNGRNYPGASFIQKMLTSYRNLSPRWLLLGEGEMLDYQSNIKEEPSLFPSYKQQVEIPKTTAHLNEKVIEKIVPPLPKEEPFPDFSAAPKLQALSNDLNEITTRNKNIESIMVLFNDKTFTVYTPSK